MSSPAQQSLWFDGPDYDPAHDRVRLGSQHQRIKALMLDGRWRTVPEIARITGDPETSISAQLRHLKKVRFGSYRLERRYRGLRKAGCSEYRVSAP